MSHNSTLIAFRAAFLRSVALIWRYTKCGKTPEIITKVKIRESVGDKVYPGKYNIVKLCDDGPNDDSLFAVLAKGDNGKVGQVIGWSASTNTIALCEKSKDGLYRVKQSHNGQKYRGLLDYFGYECPWDLDIELSLDHKRRADWKPEVTAGWYDGMDNMILYLPDLPKKEKSESLAAYYHLRPHLFRIPIFGGEHQSLHTDLGDDMGDFSALSAVLIRAMAMMSSDGEVAKKLREKLITQGGIPEQTGQTSGKALQAMEFFMGYRYPWSINIIIKEDVNARWEKEKKKKTKKKTWQDLTPDKLILGVPNKPGEEKHLDIEPIALTTYNQTGPQYPFTCN